MATDREQVKQLFEAALECDPSERRAFLKGVFATDPALRKEVESLLASPEDSDSFVEVLPIEELKALSLDTTTVTRERGVDTESENRQQIGPYRILSEIGHGGMGVVYEAEQERPVYRRVALKLIKWGMDTNAVVARFESERQALALMNHPNIASVYDAGASEQGRPYFAMELVRGEPITEYCDKNRLTIKERLNLFIQVCEGVQHAHQKGIIHRDIKPSNILITIQDDKPAPKIIDFGVAKATSQRLTERTVYTELGQLIGTPEYMSPEQAEMTGIDIDTRTDVYSLGVVLYELLVGAQPFDAKTFRQASFDDMRRKIREEEPPKPSTRLGRLGEPSTVAAKNRRVEIRSLERELRGDLDWITMRALEKDRTRRYGSPSELAADIERHLRHEAVLASPPSTVYRATKFARRHWWGVGVVAAITTLLVIFVVAMAIQVRRTARERDRANSQSEYALRVAAFMEELFRVSDPSETRGNTVTAREILDNGVNRIENEFTGDPELQARLMETMGRVYLTLGLFGPAEHLVRKTLDIRHRVLGSDHPDSLRARNLLGLLMNRQSRYAEAEALFRELIVDDRRVLGSNDEGTLNAINNLAVVFSQQGRLEEAEPLYRELLETRRRTLGRDHPDTLKSMNNLADVWSRQGRNHDAEKLLRETIDIKRRVLGSDHPSTLMSLQNLGYCVLLQGRAEEAARLVREELEIELQVHGTDHPQTLEAFNLLGMIETKLGRYDEAIALFERALESGERILGPDHRWYSFYLIGLGEARLGAGDLDGAESVLRRALDVIEAKGYSDGGAAWAQLARVAARRGEREHALEDLRRAVDRGWTDVSILDDPAFDTLRGNAAFLASLDEIGRTLRPRTK